MKTQKSRRVIAGMAVVAAVALLLAVLTGAGTAGTAGTDKSDKGYIGVYMQDLDKDLREGLDIDVAEGVLINGVEKGSPAAEAGIEDGDVIVEFDGKKVTSTDDLRDLAAQSEVGKEVTVKIIRGGETKTFVLTVGEWPADSTWHTYGDLNLEHHDWSDFGQSMRAFVFRPQLGVQVTGLNEGLAPYFKSKSGEGVLVLEVDEESVAEAAGILAGDVIQTVGEADVSTVDELRESVAEFEKGDEFDVVVLRKGKKKTLKATMDDSGTNLMWSRAPHVYKFDHNIHPEQFQKHLGPHVEFFKEDLSDEMEEMKQELKKMKKELEELKKR
jgi:S1-C subfamily serine protease